MKSDDPLVVAGLNAIRAGDLPAIERALAKHPELANVHIPGRRGGYRSPLHVVADWPGYVPHGPAIVKLLIAAGAEPNGGAEGLGRQETPLHWAASNDDVDVAEALIDGGADVDAPGGSIGTPVENAVGYGCWRVGRLLVRRGARVGKLWVAAGLGMLSRIEELVPSASPSDINDAFWQACHGGQRRAAERLRTLGADVNWVPAYAKGTPLDAAGGLDTGREALVSWLRDRGAQSSDRSA